VHQGKVRYIGSSTFPAREIVEAQWVARDRNLQRFATEQPPYSILARHAEAFGEVADGDRQRMRPRSRLVTQPPAE
jgi:aryl-alcohol dehydrogenase-like predicted oxidoreductase